VFLAGRIDDLCEGGIHYTFIILILQGQLKYILAIGGYFSFDLRYQFIRDQEPTPDLSGDRADKFDGRPFVPYHKIPAQYLHEHQHEIRIYGRINTAAKDCTNPVPGAYAQPQPYVELLKVARYKRDAATATPYTGPQVYPAPVPGGMAGFFLGSVK
jgi:hypothetical protein